MGIRNVVASGVGRKLFPSAMFIDMTYRDDSRSYRGCVAIYYGDDVCLHLRYVTFGVDYSYVVKHILTKIVSFVVKTLCIVCWN